MPSPDHPIQPSDAAREAGRGFAWITLAKGYFLFTATLSSLAFPRLFADPVLFGRYRVVSGLLNVVTMVVITATVQAVSKLASEAGANLHGVRATAIRVQTALFGPIFLMLLAGAGAIGFEDPELTRPIQAASFVILAYAYYAVLVGILNGTRRFARQAGLDMTFSTLKTGLMIGVVAATRSVSAAFGAFSIAAVAVLLLAVFVARPREREPDAETPGIRRYLGYLLPLGGYALVLNLLLQADILALKAALGAATGDADAASRAAGIYGAVKNVAMIPYQAVISLTLVVFPFVSGAVSRNDAGTATATVRGAMRVCAVLSCAAVVLLVPAGQRVLSLLFGAPYAEGAAVMLPLLAAVTALAFLFVANAILASAGRPFLSLVSGGIAAAVQVGTLAGMLPRSLVAEAPQVAAFSTLAGCACGAAFSLWFLARHFRDARWGSGAFFSVAAAAAGLAMDALWGSFLPDPARVGLALLIYLATLWVTRTVGPDDWRLIRDLVARRTRQSA